MPLATDETLNEIMGNSSAPVDKSVVNPDAETAKSTVEGKDDAAQDAKGAADGSQAQDDHQDDGKGDPKKADGLDPEDGRQKADDGKKEPYHKDPLNQRLLKERDEARAERDRIATETNEKVARLEGKIEALLAGKKTDEAATMQEMGDLLDMSSEELEVAMTKDLKGLLRQLSTQIEKNIKSGIEESERAATQERAAQDWHDKAKTVYQKYADENPTFEEMWKEGKIQTFLDGNPGHNPISAHMTLTFEERVKAEVDKRVEAKTKEITENLLAKKAAGTLGKDPAPGRKAAGGIEDKAHSTKRHGSWTSSMAEKLRQMRSGAT